MQSQIGSSRQRGLYLMHIVDQTQHFLGMVQILRCIFIFINRVVLKTISSIAVLLMLS